MRRGRCEPGRQCDATIARKHDRRCLHDSACQILKWQPAAETYFFSFAAGFSFAAAGCTGGVEPVGKGGETVTRGTVGALAA
jgi:hypothetical protein